MNEIYELLLINLRNVGLGIGIFLLSYIANISFSVYYNIKVLGQKFNKEQAINSFLKLVAFAIGCSCLVTVVTALPLFANYVGLPLPEEFVNNLTMVAILGFPMYAACKYAVMAFDKMKKVLESGTITLTEFEEEIAKANIEEVEKVEKNANEIIGKIKELENDDNNEEVKEEKIKELEGFTWNHEKSVVPETTINIPVPKPLVNNDSGSIFVDSSISSSQEAPDEINMSLMENEQLKGNE